MPIRFACPSCQAPIKAAAPNRRLPAGAGKARRQRLAAVPAVRFADFFGAGDFPLTS